MAELSEILLHERRGATLFLRLNRPERRNRLTIELVRSLAEAIESRDSDVRAIVVTGTPPAFCAGGDLPQLSGVAKEGALAVANVIYGNFHRLVHAITRASVPVVAAINGPAMGAGLDLALTCDLRLAAADAVLASSWINVGLVPGMGGAHLLARMLGGTRAAEILFLGDRIDADRAERIGLVNWVVEPSYLLAEAEAIAAMLADQPASAIAHTKAALRRALDAGLEDELATLGATQGSLFTGPDFQAAVERFTRPRA